MLPTTDNAHSIGKRYFRLMPYVQLSDPKPGDSGRPEISRSLCLRLEMIMPITADPGSRQRNQRPHWPVPAHALNHLQINSKGGLVYTGHHQRGVQEAKQCCANRSKAAGHQVTYRKGDAIADHDQTDQSAHGRGTPRGSANRPAHHQIEVIRYDAFKASFNNAQHSPANSAGSPAPDSPLWRC